MYHQRVKLYKEIEEMRNSKVIAYITGDRVGMETQISPEVVDMFSEHLDSIFNKSKKISLILYSRGGQILAAWNIVNLIKMFCDTFEVIIPYVAHSSGTLISIGADNIIMTKQATLSPVDPSVNTPFNPVMNSIQQPVSVEDVAGYFALAKKEMAEQTNLQLAFQKLTECINPLALGNVARSREQIKMLADKLLQSHMKNEEMRKKVIAFLCSDSGSHDYTISRREAKNDLKLPIEIPSDALYKTIKSIYNDIKVEMELRSPFNPSYFVASESQPVSYQCTRALLESIDGGSHRFISSGQISGIQPMLPQQFSPMPVPFLQAMDQRTQEDWTYEQPSQK